MIYYGKTLFSSGPKLTAVQDASYLCFSRLSPTAIALHAGNKSVAVPAIGARHTDDLGSQRPFVIPRERHVPIRCSGEPC